MNASPNEVKKSRHRASCGTSENLRCLSRGKGAGGEVFQMFGRPARFLYTRGSILPLFKFRIEEHLREGCCSGRVGALLISGLVLHKRTGHAIPISATASRYRKSSRRPERGASHSHPESNTLFQGVKHSLSLAGMRVIPLVPSIVYPVRLYVLFSIHNN